MTPRNPADGPGPDDLSIGQHVAPPDQGVSIRELAALTRLHSERILEHSAATRALANAAERIAAALERRNVVDVLGVEAASRIGNSCEHQFDPKTRWCIRCGLSQTFAGSPS